MPILGINHEKCTRCKQCVLDCVTHSFNEGTDGRIEFITHNRICIGCGHCIAICPEDAILRERMDDVDEFPGVEKPEDIISYDDFFHLIRAKRSIRRFKNKSVELELIEKVFEAMRYAPSGANQRWWKYILVSDRQKINELSDVIYQKLESIPFLSDNLKRKKNQGGDPIFYNAPHIIILYSRGEGWSDTDTGISFTYGMLAAETLGLGTCWIGFAKMGIDPKKFKEILGVRGKIIGAMTLGYPTVKYYRSPPRAPLKVKGLKEKLIKNIQ